MPSPVSPTWSFKWTLILSALHSLAIGVATARLLYSTKHGPLSWDDAFFCTAILGDLAMLIVFLTFETSLSDNTHLLLYWTTIDLYFLVTWTLKAAFTMMIMFVNGVRLHRYRRTIRLIACALVVVGMLYCLTSNLLCGLPFKQTHVVTSFCPVPLQIGVLNMICSVFIDVAQTATAVYLCQKDARFFYSSARPIIYFYLSANIFSIIATVVCWIEVYTRDSSDTFITIHLTNFITALTLLGINVFLLPSIIPLPQRVGRGRQNDVANLRTLSRYNGTQNTLQSQQILNVPALEEAGHTFTSRTGTM